MILFLEVFAALLAIVGVPAAIAWWIAERRRAHHSWWAKPGAMKLKGSKDNGGESIGPSADD